MLTGGTQKQTALRNNWEQTKRESFESDQRHIEAANYQRVA